MKGQHRRGAHRKHIPPRRWPRRALLGVNVLVAFALLSVGSVYGYVRYRLDSIRTVAAPHLTKEKTTSVDTSDGLQPENILLIGNETRNGLTNPAEIAQYGSPSELSGSLSDVIMILHLDPATKTASLLSIPRDLFLPMPAGSPVGAYQKVDAALNDGAKGPDELIETITDDLGIPINHYVELNFDGFRRTVNAIGGINVYFPERLFDAESLLNITTTGCVHLDGAQALALVRARHLQYDPPGDNESSAYWPYDPESDLSRIVRDHVFLRILASTAEAHGLTNPLQANAFLSAIIDQITIDPGLKGQLLTLLTHYRHLNPASVPETTLPVTELGGSSGYVYAGYNVGDVDFPVEPADDQVIAAWDSTALPPPATPSAVQVFNASGIYREAADSASALAADGLNVVSTSNGEVAADTSETFVQYHPGQFAYAISVASHMSGAVMMQSDAAVPSGSVDVQLGSLVTVSAPAAPAGAAATPPAATTTTVPTPGGQKPSSATDQLQPWDPRPCS